MRKRFILFIILLFSLSLLFSCGSLRKKTESEKAKKTGNIAGMVFDVQTMQPLSGANVYAEGITTIGTKTDTLGRFWLSAVPVGEYVFWAKKIPFHGTRVSNLKIVKDSTSIVVCDLAPSAIPEHQSRWYIWQEIRAKCDSTEFYSNYYKTLLRKKETGNVAGIVFDIQTMQPLSGANVYVEGMTTIGTKTDTLGRFWLSSIPVGEYKILAEKIYYHRGEIREVKVYNDSTSIVTVRLIINTIEPWGYMIDWDGKIIKADSVSFFSTQYKNLLRKE